MKKILVPTDFSDNAQSAFLYANELAEQFDAQVTVAHCYHPNADYVNGLNIATDDELKKISQDRLNQFVQNSFSKSMDDIIVADMVEQKLIMGFAADRLVEISKTGEYDIIVMGATGTTGVFEKIFGKVSLQVAKYAACPVLLIPAGVRFRRITEIMYASEYESADGNILLQLTELSNQLNAKVHLVHVYNENEKGPIGLGHFLLEKVFQMKAPDLNFRLESIRNDSVARGLEEFAQDENMDWMVIAKPKRNFWQRLFHSSKTNEIISNPEIPLLVMHLPSKKN